MVRKLEILTGTAVGVEVHLHLLTAALHELIEPRGEDSALGEMVLEHVLLYGILLHGHLVLSTQSAENLLQLFLLLEAE